MTESCAKATSLCLQIVELFDVTSKYNFFFLHTNFYFPGLMCSIIILLAESRLANYIFKYRNTTRAKLRLSYAIEFIIIHNLSYFFSFRLPFSRCGCCSLHPSFSFFKLHIFSSSSTVFVALTMATNRDHFQACFTLFPLLNDPSVPMRLMMMMMRARTANARDVVVHAVRASTSESRAR